MAICRSVEYWKKKILPKIYFRFARLYLGNLKHFNYPYSVQLYLQAKSYRMAVSELKSVNIWIFGDFYQFKNVTPSKKKTKKKTAKSLDKKLDPPRESWYG